MPEELTLDEAAGLDQPEQPAELTLEQASAMAKGEPSTTEKLLGSPMKFGYGFNEALEGNAARGVGRSLQVMGKDLMPRATRPGNYRSWYQDMMRAGAENISPEEASAKNDAAWELKVSQFPDLSKPGRALAEAGTEVAQEWQGLKDKQPGYEAAAKAGETVGGVAPFFAESAIPVVGPGLAATHAALETGGTTYDQALQYYLDHDYPPDQAKRMAEQVATSAAGVAGVATLGLPGSAKLAERLEGQTVAKAVARTAVAGGQGAAVMGGQTAALDALAKGTYRPELTLEEAAKEVAEQAATGFVLGAGMHGAVEAATMPDAVGRSLAKAAESRTAETGEGLTTEEQAHLDAVSKVVGDQNEGGPMQVVYDPSRRKNGKVVEGYYDDNGNAVVNAAAFGDEGRVRQVVEHESAHRDLSSEQGQKMVQDFMEEHPVSDEETVDLVRRGYLPEPGEDFEAYGRRMGEELLAQQAEQMPGWFKGMADRFSVQAKNWLGLDLSRAQAARELLRTVREQAPRMEDGGERGEGAAAGEEAPAPAAQPAAGAEAGQVTAAAPTATRFSLADERFLGNLKGRGPGRLTPGHSVGPTLGETAGEFRGLATDWAKRAGKGFGEVVREVRGVRRLTPFRKLLNEWQSKNQQTSLTVRAMMGEVERQLPSQRSRVAVTAYLQAGGDATTLRGWRDGSSTSKLARGYDDAMKLTQHEKDVAGHIADWYVDKLAEAQAWGVVDAGLENYVNQVWKQPFVGGGKGSAFAGKLKKNFTFGRQRFFGSYFEGEQKGLVAKTKDIGELQAIYLNELNKVIATKQLVKGLSTTDASDGRPLAAPFGSSNLATGSADEPVFIKPGTKGKELSDYKTLDHPALTKWKWLGETAPPGTAAVALAGGVPEGQMVMLEGQLGFHPDVYHHMRKVLGRSEIARWYDEPSGPLATAFKAGVKGVDRVAGASKQMMLGFLSPFHAVQEGTHAIGHQINPFGGLPKLDAADPALRDAMDHGLMVAGDQAAMSYFMEGFLDNPLHRLPVVGQFAADFSTWLFHRYIPALKFKTYEHILERNQKRFTTEVAQGKMTPGDVKALSAEQSNAAYGHLNYVDMGRNPTMQHLMRGLLLAPDFLEARGRFTLQAMKGLQSKTGREQLRALALLGATFFVTARVLNKVLSDDYHWDHPFSVVYGGREYAMRSVPEDLLRLFKDTRRFTYGRLSPMLAQPLVQGASGVNYRGEKTTWGETFQETALRWVPIMLNWIPGVRNLTASGRAQTISPYEQLVGSMGLQISRYSPVSQAYKLAKDWQDKQGEKPDRGVYPVSKYQGLRYALEDGDEDRAGSEMQRLVTEEGMPVDKLRSGFEEALNHPFTGSKEKDAAWKKSLEPDDLAVVKQAEQTRKDIWRRFERVKAANAGRLNALAYQRKLESRQ